MHEGLYLYCIAPARHGPPDDLRGLDDAAVLGRESGEMTLWVTRTAERPAPSLDRVRRHNRVVAASVTETTTPLPMRFGQWFADARRLEASLDGERASHRRALEEVAGALEFGVRLLAPSRERTAPAASGSVVSGREYMERLARRHEAERAAADRARDVADQLRAHLGDLVRRDRVDAEEGDGSVISVSHLVGRREFRRYREAMAVFRERAPGLRPVVTGPWPPYSFVG